MTAPLAIRVWADLAQDERTAFLARGLDDIFDPALQASIVELVAEVRADGDAEAVCAAYRADVAARIAARTAVTR